MKMNYLKPAELIIPLGLLAFIGPCITSINAVFNATTRWAILAILTLFLLSYRRRDMFGMLRRPVFWVVMIYASWGLVTVAWSEVPQISLAKALVFFWVATAMLSAGYSWVMRHESTHACNFLWLSAIAALSASLGGGSVENQGMESALYAGLTGNPNSLGFLLAIASAWLMWRAYLARRQNRRLLFLFVGLLAIDFYFLFLSHSRAAQLIVLIIALGFLIGLGKVRKFLPYALVSAVLFALTWNFFPAVQEAVTRYAFKTTPEYIESLGFEANVLFSREELWKESYELAMRGGILGGGFGVTIGEPFHGDIGATISSGEYGREQGNTQLAILEQTGLIGFSLYLILIGSIFGVLVAGLRLARTEVDRVAIGLLGGMLFGLLLQSVFEAWWVAPGSAESATFWMLLGAMLGVIRRARSDALQHRSSDAMTAQHVASAHSPAGVTP